MITLSQPQYVQVSSQDLEHIISHISSSRYTIKTPYTHKMVKRLEAEVSSLLFYSPIDQRLGHLALNQKIEVRILVGLMQKDFEKIYEEVYDNVKSWQSAASELSMIVHMSQELSKKEIVVRCTAIRNALWDTIDK